MFSTHLHVLWVRDLEKHVFMKCLYIFAIFSIISSFSEEFMNQISHIKYYMKYKDKSLNLRPLGVAPLTH